MTVTLEHASDIDRPVATVFRFVATEHVRNHPRWDPDIELETIAEEPIGVGTVIRRRNSRTGTPVEGTMEVVEYVPDKAFGVIIHDGSVEVRSRITFTAVGDNRTRVTTYVELPGMPASTDTSFLMSRLERSAELRRELLEAET